MTNDKQELLMAWNLLQQMEKVVTLLWKRYTTAFMELDRAEIEHRQSMESDSRIDEEYPF